MIEVPEFTTPNDVKRRYYAGDPYFRETWEQLGAVCDERQRLQTELWRHAALVFKPEAFVVGRVRPALGRLSEAGFTAVHAFPFEFDRRAVRETWRYQLNVATLERIRVMDMVLTTGPSLYVLLRRNDPNDDVPATVKLRHYKGPTDPSQRRPHHLRSVLGATQLSVLSFIHVADEPADLVRELGIFLPEEPRAEVLGRLLGSAGDPDGALRALASVEARYRLHDLDLSASVDRIAAAVTAAGIDPTLEARLLAMLDAVRRQDRASWAELIRELRRSGVDYDRWDEITVAAHYCSNYVDGMDYLPSDAVIPDGKSDSWPYRDP